MPFAVVRNDITLMQVDAIVNSANPRPMVGAGTDSMIHAKAGPKLLEARKKIGNIHPGCAAITPAYELNAKYVIHTVGPVWDGGTYGEADLLRKCFENSLSLALEHGCQSIAFPLIATNNYGFPKDLALQIAISVFSNFLLQHDMQIYRVVFNRSAYQLSEKLFCHVASYIDEHYVESCLQAMPRGRGTIRHRPMRYHDMDRRCASVCEDSVCEDSVCMSSMAAPIAAPMAASASLEDLLQNTDAGFTQTLLKLIDEAGKKDSEIYKKATISKQHFSKIRNNPDYKPTKATAIALALALELDVAQTNDLIGRAGYTLSNSSKFDVIIRYFIEHRNYNVVEINVALYEFDQPLLGA